MDFTSTIRRSCRKRRIKLPDGTISGVFNANFGVSATSSQGDSREEAKHSTNVADQPAQPSPVPSVVPTQTAENGLPLTTVAEEVKERCPPKAMVKPQVLTHVIEDFVIHESSEPFPVTRGLLSDLKTSYNAMERDPDEPPSEFNFSPECKRES